MEIVNWVVRKGLILKFGKTFCDAMTELKYGSTEKKVQETLDLLIHTAVSPIYTTTEDYKIKL